MPSKYSEYIVSESGTGSPYFNLSDATSTPLGGNSGGNWYDLGVVQLAAGDTSFSLTVTDYWDGATQISIVAAGMSGRDNSRAL
jgi:hypothetical protein